MFNWTIPADVLQAMGTGQAKCVLRVRYNTSTADYDGWNTDSNQNFDRSPVTQDPQRDFIGLGANVTGPLRLALNTGTCAASVVLAQEGVSD